MIHPAITSYLDGLRAADKASTAATDAGFLTKYQGWLEARGLDVLHVAGDVLARYQLWLVNEYRTDRGQPLAVSTQATAILIVKSLYRWLHRRGVLLVDPAATIVPPDPPNSITVAKDHRDSSGASPPRPCGPAATALRACPHGPMAWS
jgi:site-specific recombinase XerD